MTIAPDLPMGYHTLTVTVDGREGKAAIIAAPARIPVPEAVAEHQRWGWIRRLSHRRIYRNRADSST